eukprot:TRINITY_DN4092_c0_g1_i1.p1 TRINITY_DN4092_c0_g1~~TRINITY_DN4092_c0_g1_i1.p1  ORF type:complete len:537 (-),score=103.25 TRINITY_DN4092_c0_g1_i1:164-1774(-)
MMEGYQSGSSVTMKMDSQSLEDQRQPLLESDHDQQENKRRFQRKMKLLALGIVAAIPFFIIASDHEEKQALQTAGLTVLMAVWWLTEAIPMAVTSLIPAAFYPLFDLMDGKKVCTLYFNDSSFIFIGSGLLALAVEKWNLHRRIALTMIVKMGTDPHRLMLAFVTTSAFLSMWINNTSTALIMMPMAMAIINRLEASIITEEQNEAMRSFSTGLLLAVTYSTSVGGTATLTGTAPQLILTGQLEKLYPDAPQVSFGQWAFFAFPVMVIFVILIWAYIIRLYCWTNKGDLPQLDIEDIEEQLRKMGPLSYPERILLWVFGVTIALWFFRDPDFMDGWAWTKYITDSTPVIAAAILLFIIPASPGSSKTVLTLAELKALPWDIYLIIGGGFAVSEMFNQSGLSEIIGDFLKQLDALPEFWILFFVSFFMATLTEITSNTAATALFMPIVAELAVGVDVDPRFLMVPTAITASYAFMFPVATGANAIAYSTGMVTIKQMAGTGILLNIAGIFLISVSMYTLGLAVYDIEIGKVPSWAEQ